MSWDFMDRTRVVSSNIESIGDDADERILEVEFKSGAVYQYLNVPIAVADGLKRASSTGSYFNQHIKDRFTVRQVS